MWASVLESEFDSRKKAATGGPFRMRLTAYTPRAKHSLLGDVIRAILLCTQHNFATEGENVRHLPPWPPLYLFSSQ